MPWQNVQDNTFLNTQLTQKNISVLYSSYIIRKGLNRKGQLALNLEMAIKKNPCSTLTHQVLKTVVVELLSMDDWEEFVIDIGDIVNDMKEHQTVYIIKPSMGKGGDGICVFNTLEKLYCFFHMIYNEDENENEKNFNVLLEINYSEIKGQYLREWVIQKYVHNPLLLPFNTRLCLEKRKFHIRVYVLAIGALAIYVYHDMLVLLASDSYEPDDLNKLSSHLTNTCRANISNPLNNVENLVKSLDDCDFSDQLIMKIKNQIYEISKLTFEACIVQPISFQPRPDHFEHFGLDFLVNEIGQLYLLEINAGPDFAQTGQNNKNVIQNFMNETVNLLAQHYQWPIECESSSIKESFRSNSYFECIYNEDLYK